MRTPQKNEPIMDFLSPSATRTRWNTTEGRDHDRRIFFYFSKLIEKWALWESNLGLYHPIMLVHGYTSEPLVAS